MPTSDEKREAIDKAIDRTMKEVDKRFGAGAVMNLGESGSLDVEAIPTGSLTTDIAIGVGGLPRGRISEIYGPESSGKTTFTLHVAAQAQNMGGKVLFIDMENALSASWAQRIGVDLNKLLLSQPDHGEQALEIVEHFVSTGIDLIIIDSVSALVPRAEIEGEMGDAHVGLQARLMSQALRKVSGLVKRSNTHVIFINQIREKIGVSFGSPETTSGGRALPFYASVRMDIRRIQTLKSDGDKIGNRTRIRVKKNKVAPPFKEAEFDIGFGMTEAYPAGINRVGEIVDLAVDEGMINKRGAYYKDDDGEVIGHGRENTIVALLNNPEQAYMYENRIRQFYGLPKLGAMPKYKNEETKAKIYRQTKDDEDTYYLSTGEQVDDFDPYRVEVRPYAELEEIMKEAASEMDNDPDDGDE